MVLVVENEFLIALDLEQLLERHGWRVLGPAASVAEALRLLDGEVPDVALLDITLKDGETVVPVAEALRARAVPFVLASAYDRANLVAEILRGHRTWANRRMRGGCSRPWRKPYSPDPRRPPDGCRAGLNSQSFSITASTT